EVVRLLAGGRTLPLVVTRGGNKAAPALERIPKHRLLGNSFRSGVERCGDILSPLLPPPRYYTPTHLHHVAHAVLLDYQVYRGSRRDVVSLQSVVIRCG